MSPISRTLPKMNVLHILVFPYLLSVMDCANSASREKKTLGYRERCDKQREAYRQTLAEKRATGKTIVYADECGFRAESYRRHGYAPKGEPVFGLVSGTRTRTTTLVAARIGSTFTIPCLFDGGNRDAACFNAWVESYLCPQLSQTDVVVLDNAKIHKTRRTRQLIEASGAEVLFLSPYSPDYNPIEHDFANIKRLREYNADISIDDVINMYH
ncbi:IS630 family transposase [Candidatus Poribacteria bacterium]|nr:IS630 family transposase [Candidatus Poribacteria bacterium]